MAAEKRSPSTPPLESGSPRKLGVRSSRFPLLFRMLHLAGLFVTLPVVAVTRLLPRKRRAHLRESIFAETNCAVLTALEIGFMA